MDTLQDMIYAIVETKNPKLKKHIHKSPLKEHSKKKI